MKRLCEPAVLSVGAGRAQWMLNKSHHRPRGVGFSISRISGRQFKQPNPSWRAIWKSRRHAHLFYALLLYTWLSFLWRALISRENRAVRPLLMCVCIYTFMLDSICFCVPLQCSWMRLLYHSPLCQQAVRLIIYGVGGASSKVCGNTRRWLWRAFALVESWAFSAQLLWCGQLTLKPLRHTLKTRLIKLFLGFKFLISTTIALLRSAALDSAPQHPASSGVKFHYNAI